ncbi:class I SAM-dependent methyltransferase [Alicyclobacillus fodiniaquatilis]|uniref:Class I SAM-dependent methyltransferase n=1 Tax=Alicyclobacillus fodiniaquatilis TaxID=1661150 RepID=A0ABW4JSD0_9BACL
MTEEPKAVYEQIGVAMTCRSFQEYVDMFQLTSAMLAHGPILDVAAGAASFCAEAQQKGLQTTAVDPLYTLLPETIQAHGERETKAATEKLVKLADVYDWDYYGSPAAHEENRLRSLEFFVADYQKDQQHQRYVRGELPSLPFADNAFSLVLCSHFLFLYHDQFDLPFHLNAVRELIRVCKPGGQIRIYPLATFARERYPELNQLLDTLKTEGVDVELMPTSFRFLRGATHVLRITK